MKEHNEQKKSHANDKNPMTDHNKDHVITPGEKNPQKFQEIFNSLDFSEFDDLSRRIEEDPDLKAEFVANPTQTIKEEKISIPQGVRASYDQQYIKNPSQPEENRYGLRFGHINLTI
jgi:hypothetical protein